MAQFVKVGTRAELDELEGGKLVEVGGQKIAIFNSGGRYYAIENTETLVDHQNDLLCRPRERQTARQTAGQD